MRANAVSFQLIGTLMCAPVLILANGSGIVPLDPVWPEGVFWFYLIGVGLGIPVTSVDEPCLDLCAQLNTCPLHYLEIVSAVIMGFLVLATFQINWRLRA